MARQCQAQIGPSREELRGPGLCFVTARLRRSVAWRHWTVVLPHFRDCLYRRAEQYSCRVGTYCFMPDHVHAMLQGPDEAADTWLVIVAFKRDTGEWLAEHPEMGEWQRRFVSRVITPDESVRAVSEYILNNPVRKGLVKHWRDWPYSGTIDVG